MTTLVVGASGATGRLLVKDLLGQGNTVKAVVRSSQSLPESLRTHDNLTVIEASLLDLDDAAMAKLVQGCRAVASCLGHNVTFKGLFGPPRRLVTDATRRLCAAIRANQQGQPVKFVLMNTAANRNLDLTEPRSLRSNLIFGLLRYLLPPHADNEQAAEHLRTSVGQNDPLIEWVAVRPDTLIDRNEVSKIEIFKSPVRDTIFDAGQTSRINVAHFMARLINDDALWDTWKGQMPVIYNC